MLDIISIKCNVFHMFVRQLLGLNTPMRESYKGVEMTEIAVMLVVIVLASVATAVLLGGNIAAVYTKVADSLKF